ncbi:MAG: YceI family protein [Acidimicrobiia bacterium]
MTATTVPGYIAGTWMIDPVHSEVGFTIRHMMVSKVRGAFRTFSGSVVTAPDPLQSTVSADVELASVDTGNADRDNHLRSADFFETEAHRTMSFRSTSIREDDGELVLVGDLTLRGVTRPVELALEIGGFGPDAFGGTRAGFSATGEIKRSDFGLEYNAVLETGGLVLSDKVTINLEIQLVLQS